MLSVLSTCFRCRRACFFMVIFWFGWPAGVQSCGMKSVWEPFEPYQYMGDSGQVTGLDIDLLKAVAKEAGCQLVFDHIPWKRAQSMMSIGSLDVASGASKTPEREKYASFSIPYRSEKIAMYLRREDMDKFRFITITELADTSARVGMVHGYTYGEEFLGLQKQKEFRGGLHSVLSDEHNFKRLANSHVDVILIEPFVAKSIIAGRADAERFVRHETMLDTGKIYFMFSKKSVQPKSVDQFNQALERIKNSGEYQSILNKYFK